MFCMSKTTFANLFRRNRRHLGPIDVQQLPLPWRSECPNNIPYQALIDYLSRWHLSEYNTGTLA